MNSSSSSSTTTVHRSVLCIALLLPLTAGAGVVAAAGKAGPHDVAHAALAGGDEKGAAAITALRALGPAGMDAALAACPSGACPASERERQALDRICGVRDCQDIRLFWYTDLEAAKVAARAAGKPILSLRLLGRLDEELSCANSRFFRTVFYKNRAINELLRERFVLHWLSVRPVPKVTIDFGDGSRIEQTLTGNSIHYVLDSRGRLLEALPGLSGPEAFRQALEEVLRVAPEAARKGDQELARWAAGRQSRELLARSERLSADLGAYYASRAAERAERAPGVVASAVPGDLWPVLQAYPLVRTNAMSADSLSTSKSGGERSLLRAFTIPDDDTLRELGTQRRPRVHLDADSRNFLLRKHGGTSADEAARLIDSFETSLARDEVINEYKTGVAILRRLQNPAAWRDLDLEELNRWIYTEVFEAPLTDPWMGLAPAADVYTAISAAARASSSRLLRDRE